MATPRATQGATPPFYETDLALNKKFNSPGDRLKMEFRTEIYNVFNHTNLYLPGNISGSQGTTTATAGVGGSVPVSTITGNPSGGTDHQHVSAAYLPIRTEGYLLIRRRIESGGQAGVPAWPHFFAMKSFPLIEKAGNG